MPAKIANTLLVSRTYQPGAYDSQALNVPLGYSTFTLDIDRTDWLDPTIKVAGRIDLSLDGGQTWTLGYVAFTAEGGPLKPPSPLPGALDPNHTIVNSDLGDPSNANRQVRSSLTISGAAVKLSASLDLT